MNSRQKQELQQGVNLELLSQFPTHFKQLQNVNNQLISFFDQLSSSKREKFSQQNLVTVQTIGFSLCSGLRCSKRYDAGVFAKYHIIYSTANTRDIYIEMIFEEESSVIYFSNKYIIIAIMILKHLDNNFVAIYFTINSFSKSMMIIN